MIIRKSAIEFVKGSTEEDLIKNIEKIARTCYKSENKITDESGKRMIKALINSQHHAMLEHETITYKAICDRGVSHEIVRHRLAAYAQESTRFCCYGNDKFGSQITVVDIATGFKYDLSNKNDLLKYNEWMEAMRDAERHYLKLLELGATAQEARSVLPTSVKTEIVITMNIREWMHFINLRSKGTTGVPHPQMKEIADLIVEDLNKRYPNVFGIA